MASPAAQAKAQALNAKLEGQARVVIDDIEKTQLRKVARKAYQCSVTCYDKAGTTGASEALEQCVRQCQVPYQQANQYVQEVCVYIIVRVYYVLIVFIRCCDDDVIILCCATECCGQDCDPRVTA